MPHDCRSQKIEAGDEVIVRFRVNHVYASEEACNCELAPIDVAGCKDYFPTIACNSRFVELVRTDREIDVYPDESDDV